jgi:hypothetical protein
MTAEVDEMQATIEANGTSAEAPRKSASEVSLLRLYVMRAMYLVLCVGIGMLVIPDLLSHPASANGVTPCLLGGVAVLSLIGIRYPLQMVPVFMFEFVWKTSWVLFFGLQKLSAGPLDPTSTENLRGTLVGVVLMPLVIPWTYVWRHYVKQPGDRWK